MKLRGKIRKAVRTHLAAGVTTKAPASRTLVLAFMLIFAVGGLSLIIYSLASGDTIAVLVSSGQIANPATVVVDSTAAGGHAVKFGTAGCASAVSGTVPPGAALPSLPLTTNGRFIVSKSNTTSRVKLVSANWYGFEQADYAPAGLECQPLSTIVANIRALGINSVRLPWATDSWNSNPIVPSSAVAANPSLVGLHLHDLMDKVVNELARQGIMVVLDNHNSSPEWCCSGTDGNALWWEDYNPATPPDWATMAPAQREQLFQQGDSAWKQTWQNIVTRYSPTGSDPQPAVVGADLRNEPRNDTTLGLNSIWGGQGTPDYENWQQAASEAGNELLAINPNLLIMVEGVNYSVEFGGSDDPIDLPVNGATGKGGVAGYPVVLSSPRQLVYSPHNYSWDSGTSATKLGQWWGYILASSSYQAPIWVGEFGTCNSNAASCITGTSQGQWWQIITAYLQAGDIDWSYWALNGTRIDGTIEGYGWLNSTWSAQSLPALSQSLRALEPISQHP